MSNLLDFTKYCALVALGGVIGHTTFCLHSRFLLYYRVHTYLHFYGEIFVNFLGQYNMPNFYYESLYMRKRSPNTCILSMDL